MKRGRGAGRVIDFSNRDELRAWLEGKPREWSIVLAARAALRVLPLAWTASQFWNDGRTEMSRSAFLLTLFRTVATPLAAAISPTIGMKVLSAAYAAAGDGRTAARAGTLATAVARVADAANAAAAAATYIRSADFAAAAAEDAAFAAEAAVGGSADAYGAVRAVFANDVTHLEAGATPAVLSHHYLWDGAALDWAQSAWTATKSDLLARNENWQVWTEWYDALLAGREPKSEALAIARVSLPPEVWAQEPAAVNQAILDLRKKPPPKALTESVAKDVTSAAFTEATRQRDSAFRFDYRDGKIGVVAGRADVIDAEMASALHGELLEKARALLAKLTNNQADARAKASCERFIAALGKGFADVNPGILLARARSIEADAKAFGAKAGREKLLPEIIALMEDVHGSAGDLIACYPQARKIEAERIALELTRDWRKLAQVQTSIAEIETLADNSPAALDEARAALHEFDADVAEARDLNALHGVVADQLLVVRNFAAATVRAVGAQGTPEATSAVTRMRKELGEIGGRSWEHFKENLPQGVGDLGRILPLVILCYLMAGPIYGLAGFTGIKGIESLASAIAKLRKSDKLPKEPKPPKKRAAAKTKKANAKKA